MRTRISALSILLPITVCLLAACGGGGSGGPTAPLSGGGSRLEILLTDGPIEGLESVVVNIDRIEVHRTGGGFFAVAVDIGPFDLLKLKDRKQKIAQLDLDPGKYTQIRLFVTEGEVTVDGETHPLEIPSQMVKIIQPFDLPEGALAVMVLDFDAEESLHVVGTGSGKYILRPVVKVEGLEFFTEEDCPQVESTSPADGDVDVPLDTTVQVTFSSGTEMPLDPSGLLTVTDDSSVEVSGATTALGTTATFTLDADLDPGTIYTVTIRRSELPGWGFCPAEGLSFTTTDP